MAAVGRVSLVFYVMVVFNEPVTSAQAGSGPAGVKLSVTNDTIQTATCSRDGEG